MGRASEPAVSAAAIRAHLQKVAEKARSAAKKPLPAKRKRRTMAGAIKSGDGSVRKKKYRRRKRRQRTTGVSKAKLVKRAAPKKKTSAIAVQTMDQSDDDEPIDHGRMDDGNQPSTSSEQKRKKVKAEGKDVKLRVAEKKHSTKDRVKEEVEVIDLSDDYDDDDGPSTSSGKRPSKKSTAAKKKPPPKNRQLGSNSYVSSEDSDFILSDIDQEMALATHLSMEKSTGSEHTKPVSVAELNPTDPDAIPLSELLIATPVAMAVFDNLPMKSLNAWSQVNRYFRSMCNQAKNFKRRQCIDWIYGPDFAFAIDDLKTVNEQTLFGRQLSNIYCEPETIFAFCSTRVMYGQDAHFESSRSPCATSKHGHVRKTLDKILTDQMPVTVARNAPPGRASVIHVRTYSSLPPIKETRTNLRKKDRYGSRQSTRDLTLLLLPKITGVNIWREFMSQSDLRKQLKESGWLVHRATSRFLLPIIKDMEALGSKLLMVFSRQAPSYTDLVSSEFPVIALSNSDDELAAVNDPLNSQGLEIVAFGGKLIAYQIVLGGFADQDERSHALELFRDNFTAKEVMEKQMLLFVFHNVSKYNISHPGAESGLFEQDIQQLRDLFPRVPLFGGGYLNSIGSVFTQNRTHEDFGKFYSGMHSVIVCGVVFG